MSKESGCCSKALFPADPLPLGAHEFSRSVTSLMDGQPKDESVVADVLAGHEDMLDAIAARMYTLASMLVGEGEDSVRLIESAVAQARVSPCSNPEESRRNSRRAIAEAGIRLLAGRAPGSLDAPVGVEFPRTCIDDDDLESTGVSSAQLQAMIAGPGRGRVRAWLESLPVAQRVVFVLRAVAVVPSSETASLLVANAGPGAAGWTADSVGEVFRQALCSLASQLIQSANPAV